MNGLSLGSKGPYIGVQLQLLPLEWEKYCVNLTPAKGTLPIIMPCLLEISHSIQVRTSQSFCFNSLLSAPLLKPTNALARAELAAIIRLVFVIE
jgi:hypothetical protein